jgi:recombination protein RecR
MQYPLPLLKCLAQLKKLPGVGSRSAERFAFELLNWNQDDLEDMAQMLRTLKEDLVICSRCACFENKGSCPFCDNPNRDSKSLCVIASTKDAFSMEQTHEYKGLYHVLGTMLSPMKGIGPEHLSLSSLLDRVRKMGVKELIIALDSTLEGDATALFIKDQLDSQDISISRLAFGLPMGSSLEYVDEGTLARAFVGRNSF